MKKTKLYTALLSLTVSMQVSALGLGELVISSSLNQPFDAEIEILDIGSLPLSEIKANLASVAEYERVGLEQTFISNELTFLVTKNKQDRPIIKIASSERISEPFIQILINVAWAKGQINREYTVLLDPPDYDLIVQKSKHLVRHKSPHKHGVIDKPVYEVVEHDISANAKQVEQPIVKNEITRISSNDQVVLDSVLPPVPTIKQSEYFLPQIGSFLSAVDDLNPYVQRKISAPTKAVSRLKAQMDVTRSAIDSIHESNALLKEQLHVMQEQNKQLIAQLKSRDLKMEKLNEQVTLLMRRQGIAGQGVQSGEERASHETLLWIFILLGIAGGAYFAWVRWGGQWNFDYQQFIRLIPNIRRASKDTLSEAVAMKPKPSDTEPKHSTEIVPEVIAPSHSHETQSPDLVYKSMSENKQIINAESKEDVLAETGQTEVSEVSSSTVQPMPSFDNLSTELNETATPQEQDDKSQEIVAEQATVENLEQNHIIEFTTDSTAEPEVPVKSHVALDTLLSLAQTYLDMDDKEAARQSLQDVLLHGSAEQKKAAQLLMDKLA